MTSGVPSRVEGRRQRRGGRSHKPEVEVGQDRSMIGTLRSWRIRDIGEAICASMA